MENKITSFFDLYNNYEMNISVRNQKQKNKRVSIMTDETIEILSFKFTFVCFT